MKWLLPISLFSWLLLIATNATGQNLDLVDSLRRRLGNVTLKEKFDLYNAIGFEFRYSFPDSTIYYCTEAFEIGKEIDLPKELSKPLSFVGLAYSYKGDYKNAFRYHLQSIDMAMEQSDSLQLAYCYNNLGRMFFDQGDLVRAFDNLIRSRKIFEPLGDKSGLAYVYRSLANLYSSQKDFEKALDMSVKAYNLRAEVGEPRMIVSSLMELGLIQQASGRTKAALASFLKADSVSTGTNNPVTESELSMGVAEILFNDGNLRGGYERANEVLWTITEQTNQRLYLRASLLVARYHVENKAYSLASGLLNRTLAAAERSGNIAFQRDATFYLVAVNRALHNEAKASEYASRYKILSGVLENSDLNMQIDKLQFQVEIEKIEKENELLKANETKNLAMISRQRFQNLLLVIFVASIAAMATIIWYAGRRRKETNKQLAIQNEHIEHQRLEISKQNAELQKNNQKLSDINREKDTLMNIVAHDLKSPLNSISALSNLLETGKGLDHDQQSYLQLIKKSTSSGLALITDLLDVNELEEMGSTPRIQAVNLNSLLDERALTFQVAAKQKSIGLRVEATVPVPVNTDGTYISRIVDNLLSNAIKFSPPGAFVDIGAYAQNGSVKLKVKDNGPGFSPADRPHLFQKFKKLTARPTGGESSNGLGLAIVKTLVERLKGEIQLISEPGKGSEFIVTLPFSN